MLLRLPVYLALSLAVTGGFFTLMHALISVRGDLTDAQPALKIEFSRLRQESQVEARKRAKPPREAPKQQPVAPGMAAAKTLNPSAMAELVPTWDPGLELGGVTSLGGGGGGGGGSGGDGAGNRDALPLVRIDAEYPPRAQEQGIEGWVVVEFTISPAGTVKDPRVLEAKPSYVFDQAVLTAIRRWRYNPRVENGVPVAQAGIQVRFTFEAKGRGR